MRDLLQARRTTPARGRFNLLGSVLLLAALALLLAPTVAASSPFAPAPASEAAEPGLMDRASAWILQTQRNLHRQLTTVLHELDEAPTARTAAVLVIASFLYGIFHAAGPGHGKAVISTYLLTHRQSLGRGIWLSTAASLMQGVTAIAAVLILIGVLGWLARDTMGQVRALELASFLLVALLGLWLVWRGLRSIWRLHRERPGLSAAPAEAVAVPTARSLTPVVQADAPAILGPRPAPGGHGQGPDCGCGSPHHVNPNQGGPWYATVFAVGIRPCSGAVLVMAVSYMLGIWLAGLAAVLAMSLGTAITVSVLAILAVQARDWTRRLLRPTPLSGLRYAGPAVGIAGGAVIFFLGWTLFQGTLAVAPVRHPLGL
ncbi:nickel/cobalt transporter [Thioalkalivibrio sp.]|uniref:nickel/cobalt transporter n=1 Tax=Thioalkalivibrio sp. TaxID=2093813 RepID=UPI003568E411